MEAAGQFAQDLKLLYQAAGSPPYQRVVSWARQQKVPLGAATLCDWLNGKTTPSDPQVLRFLVEALERRAVAAQPCRTGPLTGGQQDTSSAYSPQGWQAWEAMRRAAVAERRAAFRNEETPSPSASGDDPPPAAAAPPRTRGDELRPAAHDRQARPRPWLVAAASAAAGAAATLACVYSYSHGSQSRLGDSTAGMWIPTVVGANGRPQTPQPLAGSESPATAPMYVVTDVAGKSACPQGWACFFQNPGFNASPGWMILAQTGDDVYNLLGQYQGTASSWWNRTSLDVTYQPEPDAQGPYDHNHMDPGASSPNLGNGTPVVSIHVFSDDCAWLPHPGCPHG